MRTLIIKTASSRLPNKEIKSNFGDLIRYTIVLNCINDDYLWLTDEKGKSLLKYFVPENKILTPKNFSGFLNEEFKIYNFDNYIFDEILFKLKGRWNGFILKKDDVIPENEKIAMIQSYFKIKDNIDWQQNLIECLGFEWKEQDYINPNISEKIEWDIGFNDNVHVEWISKKWPDEYWQELKNLLEKEYTISFQKGLNDFEEYIKWMSSCKIIITCDTLGLHLASALRKKVIVIKGPTKNMEHGYGRITFLYPQKRECMPCNSKECMHGKSCINEITPAMVKEEVIKLMRE